MKTTPDPGQNGMTGLPELLYNFDVQCTIMYSVMNCRREVCVSVFPGSGNGEDDADFCRKKNVTKDINDLFPFLLCTQRNLQTWPDIS
jgi:hypothetical protein